MVENFYKQKFFNMSYDEDNNWNEEEGEVDAPLFGDDELDGDESELDDDNEDFSFDKDQN